MTSINPSVGNTNWATSSVNSSGGAQAPVRSGSSTAGALGEFQLPDLSTPEGVVAFAKPILKGALGVDLDLLGGQSPAALVSGLISMTRTQGAEGKRDIYNSATGLSGSSAVKQSLSSAADNYDVDVGKAIVDWASNPSNFETGFKFASQVVETVVAAVASGGTSLIKDLPALGASAMLVADDILKESGLSLEQVLGSAATDVLTSLGMDPADAAKLGPFLASAGIAGVQVYNAIERGDLSGLDPKVFVNLAKNGAILAGADRDTANTVAGVANAGLSFSDAFLNGRSDLFNSGNLSGLLDSGKTLGAAAEAFVGGRGVDLQAVLGEGQKFLELFGGVMRDLERDTNTPGLAERIGNGFNSRLSDTFDQLGPFGPAVQMAMDALLQNGYGNRTTV